MKFYLALVLARLARLGIKILNKSSGTSFGGKLALTICPDFLKYCPKYITNDIITITGTNGKSTTSGLVAQILQTTHQKIIHNLDGANMLTGFANVFALNLKPLRKFDYAVLECDEAYLTKLYDYINSNYLIVTNIFKDQVDRYGDINVTANYIKNAINKNPSLKLILNADDPTVAEFSKDAIFYGLDSIEYEHLPNFHIETFNCKCSNQFTYTKQFFAHQGHYYCEKCDFKRPECKYSADVKVFKDYSILNVKTNGINFEFKINLVGAYNAYNALASIALAFELGLNQQDIQKAFDSYHTLWGRSENRTINGHSALIQLIKNPAGANEVLKTVDLNSNIVIAINNNTGDGKDISWLNDTDFEQIKDAQKMIITSGLKANDMAQRLVKAGISQDKIQVIPDVKKAVEIATRDGKTTILPTYTALLSIKNEGK